ncbi:DNA gyrase subunit A [Candidatus Westeberhardia cardiocondylae]|uniref:DNA gyrase subunit A n=1 Tax=Candidatus Westeberhardia cardiocondylae TaxID=1594731 RepID=A0A0H5BX80_9ENTR|nr:DNA gyrase subunit A [Candidatus Westeberhardia cardiocondylae]
MKNQNKNITTVYIEEELKQSYLDYAMSVIIGRALPDVRDGLKPVHRRILYAMNILGNDWNKPHKKSARIVGDVIGKYHPHGDNAVYETIVRMAQLFSLRYILIDGQGNFGSIDGDSAAAMRYTEIRMTKIAHELLFDLKKNTVDYVPNYDETEKIPSILPSKIPNLLINGSSGIAVGMATNIPPHNLTEVINACLIYINNKNVTVEDLMKHIQGPDFPTAAIINGTKGIYDAYNTGKGKIYIQARAKIKINKKNGRETIIISEIPYQINKAKLIEKIANLTKEKRIEGISNLRDESDKDGIRIVINIKKNAIGNIVLKNLYLLSQMQTSFGINMVALYKGKPKTLSLKEILSAFLDHRKEIVTRRTIFELKKTKERIHVLKALAIAIDNIDSIIPIIQKSLTSTEAKKTLKTYSWNATLQYKKNQNIQNTINNNNYIKKEKNNISTNTKKKQKNYKFIKEYYLSEKQVQSILNLKLYKLTNLEKKQIIEEYSNMLEKKYELIHILQHSNKLKEIIQQELILIKNEYNDLRRTKIIKYPTKIHTEDLINKKKVIVTLSNHGYVKYQPLTEYDAQKRGGKGKSAANIKNKDFIHFLLVTNTHDTILLFSNQGKVYWMKVYQLPESNRTSRGRPIVNLLPLKPNEKITTILPVKKYEEASHIFMATANGTVKKTSFNEFIHPRNTGLIAINLNKGDELIGVDLTNGNSDIMLFSSYGKVVRFSEKQVRNMGRKVIGVQGINLKKGDKVVSLIIPKNKSPILTITKNGYGKRTKQSEYPKKSRATQGVISIKVTKRNGKVVSAVQADNSNQIMIITDAGTLVRIRVSEINIVSRNTQGVRLIRTIDNEHVVGLQRII